MQTKTNLFYIEYSEATLELHTLKEVIYSQSSSNEEKKRLFRFCPTEYCLHLSFSTNAEAMTLFDRMRNQWKLPVEIYGNRIMILPAKNKLFTGIYKDFGRYTLGQFGKTTVEDYIEIRFLNQQHVKEFFAFSQPTIENTKIPKMDCYHDTISFVRKELMVPRYSFEKRMEAFFKKNVFLICMLRNVFNSYQGLHDLIPLFEQLFVCLERPDFSNNGLLPNELSSEINQIEGTIFELITPETDNPVVPDIQSDETRIFDLKSGEFSSEEINDSESYIENREVIVEEDQSIIISQQAIAKTIAAEKISSQDLTKPNHKENSCLPIDMQILGGFIAVLGIASVAIAFTVLSTGIIPVASIGIAAIIVGIGLFAKDNDTLDKGSFPNLAQPGMGF